MPYLISAMFVYGLFGSALGWNALEWNAGAVMVSGVLAVASGFAFWILCKREES